MTTKAGIGHGRPTASNAVSGAIDPPHPGLADLAEPLALPAPERELVTRSCRVIKGAFDFTFSLLGLIVLSPILLVIALAIRIDSPGPILFRQRRAGHGDEVFQMVKFRSMVVGAEDQREELAHLSESDGVFKLRDDPRVTRVGQVIRRFSLDELPQLFNVLIGDMSLVGPRPLPLDEDRRIEGAGRRRLQLRPGITGPWQILRVREPLREMVEMDVSYIAEWSLWTDVLILLRTIPYVAGRRGI